MEKIKSAICIAIFLFINFAFSIKYLSRLSTYYILFSVLIISIYCVFWSVRFQLEKIFNKAKYPNIGLLIVFTILSTLVFVKIPVETLNVDRWSVINSFWDNYFNGKYVYFAKSNAGNPPGPMPFYFILALPFYLFGELGYFSILGIVSLAILLYYNSKRTDFQSIYLILIMASPFYLWEVICRSNIFFNGILVLFSILYFLKSLEYKKPNYVLWNGILIGLILSTRNVFIIPFIIAFLFSLKQEIISMKTTFIIGIIAIFTFIFTFIPFVFNHFVDFTQMNPFIIQSSFLMPFEYSFLCVSLSFGTLFIIKNQNDVYFYSGLILFLSIVLHYVYQIKENNFNKAFYNSYADISYFILCIPFLVFYVIENENRNKKILN